MPSYLQQVVGENPGQTFVRSCRASEFLGIKIRQSELTIPSQQAIVSTDDSKVKVVVVPTDEESVIARDTMELVK